MTPPLDPFARNEPFEPFDPLEFELRRSLAEHAQDAPDAGALTDRLLAAGAGGLDARSRRNGWTPSTWKAWGTPLVAAACVALIVGIVLAVVRPGHSDHGGPDAVDSPSRPVPVSSPATSAVATPSVAPTSASASPASGTALPVLQDVRVVDLTFTGEESGWALGSAACLTGPGRCTALLRTTDGTRWGSVPNSTPFVVPGVSGGCPASRCVTHLRFADTSVGYAFGPDALYLTVNGALSWTKLAGGADALETLDNNVIRVSVLGSGKPSLLTSAVGGTSWTARSTAGFPADPVGVTLTRSGRAAVLALTRFDAAKGNGRNESGVLLRSADDGATWTSSGDPCPEIGTGYTDVLAAATLALDGSVVADCATRNLKEPSFLGGQTITSTDGGGTFDTPANGGKLPPATTLGAASQQVQLVVPVGSNTLYRSTDRGNTWGAVAGVTAAKVGFLGFESATIGRLVTDDGRTVWTTRDAGARWTKVSF